MNQYTPQISRPVSTILRTDSRKGNSNAPTGARILVRNAADELIYRGYQPEHGYSSNDMISELDTKPKTKWRTLKPGKNWPSEWFLIDDITRDLEKAATETDPKHWKSFKVIFDVTVDSKNSASSNADSGWQLFQNQADRD